MLSPKSKIIALLALVAGALTGCVGNVSYPTIEPLSFKPSAMAPAAAVEVDSLTPTFKWRCPDPTEKDDLAIWRLAPDGSPGETFVFKRNIPGGQYTLEEPLTPGEEYFWSVKSSGSFIWAKANYVGVSPLGAAWQNGLPFKIKAPVATPVRVATPAPVAALAPDAVLASTVAASANTASPYGPLEKQIGGTWWCQLPPDMNGVLQHEEAVFTWADNEQGIKGDLWLVRGDVRGSHTTQLTVWNSAERKFLLTGTDSEGNLKQSVTTLEGDVMVSDLTFTKSDGTIVKAHARGTFLNADLWRVEVFKSKSGQWVKVQDMVFERHRP
jgi:hypothetical protein